MSLNFSFDKHSGGFYFYKRYAIRLCLGHFAITYIPNIDFDEILEKYIKYNQMFDKDKGERIVE